MNSKHNASVIIKIIFPDASVDLHYGNDKVHLTILKNPSHLEAVNPVSVGKTRAKQMMHRDGDYGNEGRLSDKILNLQVGITINSNAVQLEMVGDNCC